MIGFGAPRSPVPQQQPAQTLGLLGPAPQNPFLAAAGLLGQVPQPQNAFINPPVQDEDAQWRAAMAANFAKNKAYAKTGEYSTKLNPNEEQSFLGWVKQNGVPFNQRDQVADYDMRGYWKDIAAKGSAETSTNPNDHQTHYPDTYKTPYHQSFSAESKYAQPNAPVWINDHQLADPATGKVVFDERANGR